MTTQHFVEQINIIELMEEYGGNFVKALAKAWRLADPDNRQRLAAAFPDYWKKYEGMWRMKNGGGV